MKPELPAPSNLPPIAPAEIARSYISSTLAFVIVADTAINLLLFAPVYLMTQGGPSDSSNVLMYMTYNTAFAQGRMGYAAAIAVVLLIISSLVILLQLRSLRSDLSY